MRKLTWLHITDLHCGIAEQDWLWPTIRDEFYRDIRKVFNRSGPWSVVIFSGDLTQSGCQPEFEALTRQLQDLWEEFGKMGMSPRLFAVPGNHDLRRPAECDPWGKLLVSNYWRDPTIRESLFTSPESGYRKVLSDAFSAYTTWWNTLSLPKLEISPGLLPGDGTSVIDEEGFRVGLVGLNTAYLQLSDGDYESKLDIDSRQLSGLCGQDLPRWCAENDANLLVTHHPPTWYHARAQDSFRQHVDLPGRFAAQLCGHVHENIAKEEGEGGAPPKRIFQARSLYGLRYFKKGARKVVRQHGYCVGQLEIESTGSKAIHLWPRKNDLGQSGQLKLVPDYTFDLDDNTGSASWAVARRTDVSAAQALVSFGAPPTSDNLVPIVPLTVLESVNIVEGPVLKDSADLQLKGVPRWALRPAPHHFHVRDFERETLRVVLQEKRICWVAADWGLGKDGFLSSVLVSQPPLFSEVFRVNCEAAISRNHIIECATEQLGMPFQAFSLLLSALPSACLVFDNIPESTSADSVAESVEDIAKATRDLCPNAAMVLTARLLPHGTAIRGIELKPLDEAECARYVSAHPDGGPGIVGPRGLDQLFARSEGLPMHLDRMLKELQTVSIEELSAIEPSEDPAGFSAEPVPPGLVQAVAGLRRSEDKYTRRSWQLLKLLTVLAHGETFQRIHKFNSIEPFYIQNVEQLRELGLIETVSIATVSAQVEAREAIGRPDAASSKRLVVPRQVRDYIEQFFIEEDRKSIAAQALELYFGKEWRDSPKIAIAGLAGRCESYSGGPGNAHIVTISAVRDAISANDDIQFRRVVRLIELNLSGLKNADRFRDLANASQEAYQLLEGGGKRSEAARAAVYYGDAMRMLGHTQEAVSILEKALQYAPFEYGKGWFAGLWLSLALAHEGLKDYAAAVKAAEEIQVRVEPDSAFYYQAQAIKIECGISAKGDSTAARKSLIELEGRAREKGFEIVANNVALFLARTTTDAKKRRELRAKVIGSREDLFNRITASLDRASELMEGGCSRELSVNERKFLGEAYSYLYSQRLSSFDMCHRILWQLYRQEDRTPVLLRLFRFSSYIWRIFGRKKEEQEYLAELQTLIPDPSASGETEEAVYFGIRLRAVDDE